jgi:Domain of unknown function (DUF4157)
MERQHLSSTKNLIVPSQSQSHTIARSSTHPIEELQGAIGNKAVNKLLAKQPIVQAKPMFRGLSHELVIQPKLTIGAVGDKYEQEADRVAEQVVGQINSSENQVIQRQQMPEKDEELRMKPTIQRLSDGNEMAAATELEASIQQAKIGGLPLPEKIREPAEQAFQMPLDWIRVHSDERSNRLNQSIQSVGFTNENHIFLQQKVSNPDNRENQKVYFHELTHAVQQSGSAMRCQPENNIQQQKDDRLRAKIMQERSSFPQKSSAFVTPISGNSQIIQRLKFQNTDWEEATRAEVSEGGGSGVIFVSDNSKDPPVVVKPNEIATSEAILAAYLHDQVHKNTKKDDKWSIETPNARLADQEESKKIKNKVENLWANRSLVAKWWANRKSNKDREQREKKLSEALQNPGVMIYTAATGKDFRSILKKSKHSEKKFPSKERKFKENSPLNRFFNDEKFIQALGQIAAVDIYLGNFDRLIGLFNPENFLVDEESKIIQLIDNVFFAEPSFFQSYKKWEAQATKSLEFWKKERVVEALAKGEYQTIAENTWFYKDKGLASDGGLIFDVRNEDKETVKTEIPKYRDRFIENFALGLKQGKENLINFFEQDQKPDITLPKTKNKQREEVQESLRKRALFLRNDKSTSNDIVLE